MHRRIVLALCALMLIIPASAQAFSNGALPSSALAPAHTDQAGQTAYLANDFAAAFNDMRVCANRAGVSLSGNYSEFHPAATYNRSLNVQWILYRTLRGRVLVAYPGTSNHGWGRALDASPNTISYFWRHGAGWSIRKVEAFSEPWHWNYVGDHFRRPDPGTSLRFPVLRTGSGGECLAPAVKELQRRLRVDQSGNFGNGTRRVLKEWQRDNICKKCGSGVVGKTTWLKLREQRGVPHPNYVRLTSPVRMAHSQDVLAVIGLLNARRKEQRQPPILNDGVFGQNDSRALKNFQRSRHLDDSGVAGPKTLKALRTPSRKAQRASAHRIQAAQRAGFEVKSVKKARRDYGCAKVHSSVKRQTCKVRALRGQWQRRLHYAKSLHGHERGVWLTRAKNMRKAYNHAKATLHKLERVTTVDEEGVRFVAGFEGLYHRCYNDGATAAGGYATIGYGRLLHYSPCTAHDRTLYWSTDKALSELHKDLRASERVVASAVHVKLNQRRFSRLASFVFNIGAGGFRSSTLLVKLNQGCYSCVRGELLRWDKAGGRVLLGLHRRRVAEGVPFP